MNANARVAVVTGGAQGIGRRTAELLSERGFRLAIIDLHDPAKTVKAIEGAGGDGEGTFEDISGQTPQFAIDPHGIYVDSDVLNATIPRGRAGFTFAPMDVGFEEYETISRFVDFYGKTFRVMHLYRYIH